MTRVEEIMKRLPLDATRTPLPPPPPPPTVTSSTSDTHNGNGEHTRRKASIAAAAAAAPSPPSQPRLPISGRLRRDVLNSRHPSVRVEPSSTMRVDEPPTAAEVTPPALESHFPQEWYDEQQHAPPRFGYYTCSQCAQPLLPLKSKKRAEPRSAAKGSGLFSAYFDGALVSRVALCEQTPRTGYSDQQLLTVQLLCRRCKTVVGEARHTGDLVFPTATLLYVSAPVPSATLKQAFDDDDDVE